ncbi:MAG TPA: hypothetical protein VFS05_11170 [Gemmatimonadaceae bacterium]|nr:hypothetical protein [Gemmatimonadaceae bacterium]
MNSPRSAPGRIPASTLVIRAAALGLAALGFLPIANWIAGGHEAPWYRVTAEGWLSGSALVLGVGVVLAIISRRVPALWREDALAPIAARFAAAPVYGALLLVAAAGACYALIARFVFSARPLFVDELAQLMQARIFAGGALTTPTPAHPEFFSSMLVLEHGGRQLAHFPPGAPAMLAIGELLHAPWLVAPVCGAISVAAFVALLRIVEPRASVALGAALLFAFAPFVAFMSGTHMNHVTSLAWILVGLAATAHVAAAPAPRPALALLAGLAFGAAATIRPADALAFSLPAGVWLLARALRQRALWWNVLAAGVGVAIPVAALLWFNARTTGSPFLFAYDAMWGPQNHLGFHEAPWGPAHTPLRGLELLSLYMLRLQSYLFESPLPSLLPAIVALALVRRVGAADAMLLGGAALLLGLYFAYWHDGFYLGPRYVYSLTPVLALWTARALPELRARIGGTLAYRAAVYTAITAVALAGTMLVPARARAHAASLAQMRWDADSAAAASRVSGALVLVRESWGAQLMPRLWALGVPRTDAERLYRAVDACVLEEALTTLERGSARGADALALLRPLARDSARVARSTLSPDDSERMLPGLRYTPRCAARVADDRAGFTLLPPLLLARGDNIYARDLHERDTLLLKAYPARPVYLLRPSGEPGAAPEFHPLDRDSLWRAWRGAGEPAPRRPVVN